MTIMNKNETPEIIDVIAADHQLQRAYRQPA
jgi:hypothetical protein